MRNLLALFLLVLTASSANAALVITEVMSSSSGPTEDWWELTNTGPAAVNLNNYYWDDNGPMGADGASFGDFEIAVGQSIIISDSVQADFEAVWGTGFTVLDQTFFSGPDTFSGLSSGGDQIELWDADPNAGAANLVASVTFPAATAGFSFEWDTSGNSLGLSVAGENGAVAVMSGGNTDVGSPGFAAVPEPSSLAILAAFSLSSVVRRRRA